MGADTLVNVGPVTVTGGGVVEFDTSAINAGLLTYQVTAFTGGTNPITTWAMDVLVGGSTWVQVFTDASQVVADGRAVVSLTPVTTVPLVFTQRARIRWGLAGDVAPTNATITYAFVGRS